MKNLNLIQAIQDAEIVVDEYFFEVDYTIEDLAV